MANPLQAPDCCAPVEKAMTAGAATHRQPLYVPSEWRTSHEPGGIIKQSVPCPPKNPKACTRIKIDDTGSTVSENYLFNVKVGCDTHSLKVCNPRARKLLMTVADVRSYWESVFYSDPNIGGAGIYPGTIAVSATATGDYSIEIQLCPPATGCGVAISVVSAPTNAVATATASAVAAASALKPGMFVSYDTSTQGLAIVPFSPMLPYAGFYELPTNVRNSADMAMRLNSGNTIFNGGNFAGSPNACCDSSCACAGSGCCVITRTGDILVKLTSPLKASALVGQPVFVQDAMGGLTIEAQGFTPPTGSTIIPSVYTFLLNAGSIGSSVISAVLAA